MANRDKHKIWTDHTEMIAWFSMQFSKTAPSTQRFAPSIKIRVNCICLQSIRSTWDPLILFVPSLKLPNHWHSYSALPNYKHTALRTTLANKRQLLLKAVNLHYVCEVHFPSTQDNCNILYGHVHKPITCEPLKHVSVLFTMLNKHCRNSVNSWSQMPAFPKNNSQLQSLPAARCRAASERYF